MRKIVFEDLPKGYVDLVNGFGQSWPVDVLKEILVNCLERNLEIPDFGVDYGDVYIHTVFASWCLCAERSFEVFHCNEKKEEFDESCRDAVIEKILSQLGSLIKSK